MLLTDCGKICIKNNKSKSIQTYSGQFRNTYWYSIATLLTSKSPKPSILDRNVQKYWKAYHKKGILIETINLERPLQPFMGEGSRHVH